MNTGVAGRSGVKGELKPRRPFLEGVIASQESIDLCSSLVRWKKAVRNAPRKKGEPGRLSPRARDLAHELVALFAMAKDDGLAWPTERELARNLECSVDTVQRALKELRDGGYLMAIRLRVTAEKADRQNVYALRLPAVEGFFLGYEDEFPKSGGIAEMPPSTKHFCGMGTPQKCGDIEEMNPGILNPGIECRESVVEPFHPTTTLSPSGEASRGGDENVVDLDSRRAPSAPSAPAESGGWPRGRLFAPSDDPLTPGNEYDFARVLHYALTRHSTAQMRAAIGFDPDYDRPDHRWLPTSIRESIVANYKAGRLSHRTLLDALWPCVASGELRAAFDAARLAKWEREGDRVEDGDPRRREWRNRP